MSTAEGTTSAEGDVPSDEALRAHLIQCMANAATEVHGRTQQWIALGARESHAMEGPSPAARSNDTRRTPRTRWWLRRMVEQAPFVMWRLLWQGQVDEGLGMGAIPPAQSSVDTEQAPAGVLSRLWTATISVAGLPAIALQAVDADLDYYARVQITRRRDILKHMGLLLHAQTSPSSRGQSESPSLDDSLHELPPSDEIGAACTRDVFAAIYAGFFDNGNDTSRIASRNQPAAGTSAADSTKLRDTLMHSKPSDFLRGVPLGPSWLRRNWLRCIMLYGLAHASFRFWRGVDLRSLLVDGAQAAWNFLNDRIYEPLGDLYKTIRYKRSDIGIVQSPRSLSAEVDSLVKMVLAFASKKNVQGLDMADLERMTREGDLSVVMRQFEEDIQKPIRGAIFGDLLQTALIQIQKAKVDLQAAMAALDKLLRSSEINFKLMAVMPAMALAWAMFRTLLWLFGRVSLSVQSDASRNARLSVLELQRAVDRTCLGDEGPSRAEREGEMIVAAYVVRRHLERLTSLPSSLRMAALQEIDSLLTLRRQDVESETMLLLLRSNATGRALHSCSVRV